MDSNVNAIGGTKKSSGWQVMNLKISHMATKK
jgi:hypothetical protein